MSKPILLAAVCGLALALPSDATDTIQLGGPGAPACATSSSPATLADGLTEASATFTYDWDAVTRVLSVTVDNTSPVQVGVPNPQIGELLLNLPESAVSSVSLLSQASAGGAQPTFTLQTDLDSSDGGLKGACFGGFNVRLTSSISGGAIANPAADTLAGPAGAPVLSPVVFEFAVDGPGVDSLTSSTFAGSFSVQPSGGEFVNALAHFQGGGINEASDWIGNAHGCEPAGWYTGAPSIGSTITFTQAASPGCHGCLLYSFSPGPIQYMTFSVPLGLPMYELIPAQSPPSGIVELDVTIPDEPALVGLTVYFAVATADAGGIMDISDGFTLTIQS